MPKISSYNRQQSISGQGPSVPMDVSSAGNVGRAFAGVGESIGNIGLAIQANDKALAKELETRREKLRLQDNANKEINFRAAFDDEALRFETEETTKTGQDAYDNIERADKFRDDSIQTFTEGIDDPDLKNSVAGYIQQRHRVLADRLAKHQVAQRDYVADQAIGNVASVLTKEAYAGVPLSDVVGRFTDSAIKQGRGEDKTIELITKTEQALAEAHLDGLVNRDPVAALVAIKRGEYHSYLPAKKIEEFDTKAKQIADDLQKGVDEKKKEEERAKKAEEEKGRAEANKTLVDLEADGKLTRTALVKYRDTLNENEYRQWQDRISSNSEKAAKATGEYKTDNKIEADLFSRIVINPNSVSELEITGKIGHGLSTEAAKGLLSVKRQYTEKTDDPLKSEQAKTAISQLNFARTSKLFSKSNLEENNKLWAEKVGLLQRFIVNHPDEDASEFVGKLLEPVKVGFVQKMLDIIPSGRPGQEAAEATRKSELSTEAGPPKKKTPKGARQAPDGNYYVPDPARPGKYLRVD